MAFRSAEEQVNCKMLCSSWPHILRCNVASGAVRIFLPHNLGRSILDAPQRTLQHDLSKGLKQAMVSKGATNIAACVDAMLQDAVRHRVSDIHLSPQSDGMLLRMRIDGNLYDTLHLTEADGNRFIRHFKAMADLDTQRSFKPVVARRTATVDDRPIDLRLSLAPTVCGEKLAVRLLDSRQIDQQIGDVGFSDSQMQQIQLWLGSASGLCLITGPIGSGKTSTLYALLKELAKLERSVVTIEDPVEYQLNGVTQLPVDTRHDFTFEAGIHASLRLDPNYIVLGEVRDEAAAKATLRATSSGHPVLSTLHSRDAVGTVTTLRNWGLTNFEIAASLQIVVAQRLVRVLCSDCRRQESPSPADALWLESLELPVPGQVWHATGCTTCEQLGFVGRTGVFEVWTVSGEDQKQILNHADETTLRTTLAERGHESLLADGLKMAAEGITTLDELRMLGGFYVPPPKTASAERLSATMESDWL